MRIIDREFGYRDSKPVMILRPVQRDNRKRFVIKLEDLWKYSDTHNEHFESFIANKMIQILMLFDIDVPMRGREFTQVMSSVSDVIMGGIDELVKMPPYREGAVDPSLVIGSEGAETGLRLENNLSVAG